MTIEELKDLRELMILKIELGETLSSIPTRVISLIDAEIERQSVKSGEVAEAIEQIESLIKAIGNDMHWRSDKLMESLDLAITALQQMSKEPCEYCGTDFLFECNLINDNGDIHHATIADFCPMCGRKLR